MILTQEDEEEKRHFVYFGIAGVVLAAVVASKTSFKAEVPLDEKTVSEFIQEEPKKQDEPAEESPRKSCVICVGSTGTGKSTLIKIMTGADVETSSRADSVTKTSSIYSKRRGFLSQDNKKPLQHWIDTQGWEDSDIKKQDNQIFKDIFQCLYDSEMTEISGIVWNINPNERATDTLQRQARLIAQSSIIFKQGF